ncbi:sulfotransferase family 2 domain-containing protein [Verrucomicrobiaceae bacterium N1E253]|uniref:Sulfotransferase family 2 domain-containing protein n=1 Tax=Oceaniferula marina TaxID=2748318 RepID=A0A851GG94_9BACT|nr:sulfotransferase family 2 domain-containing protein [Oceaniferula marina]NWK56808.1 sulfotransferase family 2 domain-containing protein [Oceaniferula marina]
MSGGDSPEEKEMNLSDAIETFRLRRKLQREKPHIWRIPSVNVGMIQNYKVGSRSLRLAVARHLLQSDEGEEDIAYDQLSDSRVKELDKKYSGFYALDSVRQQFPEMFLFTFVRHPLSRLHSCYVNKLVDAKRYGVKNQFKNWGVDYNTSFDEFVRMVADTPDGASDRHFRSQSWFVSVDGKLVADYIGKLESFKQDWQVLADRFGFPELPHKNKSSKSKVHFSEHYSKEIYELAVERYRQDIELLGYEDEV